MQVVNLDGDCSNNFTSYVVLEPKAGIRITLRHPAAPNLDASSLFQARAAYFWLHTAL